MPRILACLDEVPAADGTCVQEAWVQQTAWPTLPSIADAELLGGAMLGVLLTIRAMVVLLQPPKEVSSNE